MGEAVREGPEENLIDLCEFNGNWRKTYFVLMKAWVTHLATQGLS